MYNSNNEDMYAVFQPSSIIMLVVVFTWSRIIILGYIMTFCSCIRHESTVVLGEVRGVGMEGTGIVQHTLVQSVISSTHTF